MRFESEFFPEGAVRGKGFCVEIKPEDYPVEGCFAVVVWNQNSGWSTQVPIRELSKARRIAKFMYATHYPEWVANEAAKEIRYAELDAGLKASAEERRVVEEAKRTGLMAKITPDTPRVELAVCPSCEYVGDPDEFEQPVYECSRCGATQVGEENRRCETDNIFMARVGDLACPSCEDALDETPELVSGVLSDGEFIPETEIETGELA